ncbi:MAG: hypothetical protein DWQ31_03530 [Planctomycetota bacterium]|nr:MAG: hypothetical protein DWQ31_03530 [Planctomycetota bacterium]REJ97671.1 MAG: hypothetical protein DWQ35_01410 [Planctomycetota bacterium]REK23385.1 MAG: hypothetical protein DWQ42_15360 [Planctomycetota bacterium]REK48664.1 MAG: hypothetical protein DWQ46_01920 [Planctomycetota bacterium]
MDPHSITLREFHDKWFARLFHGDVRERTHEAYEGTLKHWERHTDNLPLAQIDQAQVSLFRAKLAESLRPATVSKHCRHLNHLLEKIGPPARHNRDALHLIKRVPWAKPLVTSKRLPRPLSQDELRELYDATEVAVKPHLDGVSPADYWRAKIVAAYNLGYRRKALLSIAWDDTNLRAMTMRCDESFDKKRQEREKPFNGTVREHLLKIRTGEARVFCWRHGKHAWYEQFRAIVKAANLNCTFHNLKATCGTTLARMNVSVWAIRYMLDHAQTDVAGQSYINPIEELREVVDSIPQPWQYTREQRRRNHG